MTEISNLTSSPIELISMSVSLSFSTPLGSSWEEEKSWQKQEWEINKTECRESQKKGRHAWHIVWWYLQSTSDRHVIPALSLPWQRRMRESELSKQEREREREFKILVIAVQNSSPTQKKTDKWISKHIPKRITSRVCKRKRKDNLLSVNHLSWRIVRGSCKSNPA